MTDEELIARLRDEQPVTQDFQHTLKCALMDAAADRIEALTKERDQWISHAKAAIWSDSEELKETERKLAKAVEGLTVIDALDPEGLVNGCSQSALIGLVLRMGEIARAALAEIKGENHE